jgi:hypothetical protein
MMAISKNRYHCYQYKKIAIMINDANAALPRRGLVDAPSLPKSAPIATTPMPTLGQVGRAPLRSACFAQAMQIPAKKVRAAKSSCSMDVVIVQAPGRIYLRGRGAITRGPTKIMHWSTSTR